MNQDVETDPFAGLSFPAAIQTSHLYISGRLDLILINSEYVGDWICHAFLTPDPVWYRRLDADAYLWLRDRVNAAIESGKLADNYQDALQRLEWIAECGVAHGAFTAEEVGEDCRPLDSFSFSSGLPRWADDAAEWFT